MTNDEIIARGRMALRIMADAPVQSFFQELRADIEAALFQTLPDQTAERERLYFRHQGLADVLDMMSAYASRAEELLDNPE